MKPNSPRRPLAMALAALALAPAARATAVIPPGPPAPTGGLDELAMMTGLLGGLALFLYGMEKMTEALQAAAGDAMKDFLGKVTSNRFLGVATGAFVTAVIQSSSVTTVLVVGFISAGLMTLQQSIGVIMGANLGTTITAQIVAFKVTKAALPMIAVGYGLIFAGRRESHRHAGGMLMGLGMLFFGMGIMSDAMAPLRTHQPFIDLMSRMENPLLGIGVAALFTALVQSSSATTGIVIVMASQGLVTLPAGIALALGANIGTCITALLASIGKPREAKRAAAVHVLFNTIGVVIWIWFIPYLADLVVWFSPAHPQLSGVARTAAEVPRQIANANTFFNLFNTFFFIGFTGAFARAAERMVPDEFVPTAVEVAGTKRARYLDEGVLETPVLALELVRWEIADLGERVYEMLRALAPASIAKDKKSLESIRKAENHVDRVRDDIRRYLGKIRELSLTKGQSSEVMKMVKAVEAVEFMADVVAKDLVKLSLKAMDEGVQTGETYLQIMNGLYEEVIECVDLALHSFREGDREQGLEVIGRSKRVKQLVRETLEFQASHLDLDDPDRLVVFRIEMETVDDLRRVYTLAKRLARIQAPKPRKRKSR